jgi:hypothetical protein
VAVGKRGVFFTLIAIITVVFVITTYSLSSQKLTTSSIDTEASRVRISVLNNYIETFERQAGNSLRTAGYLSLQNLSDRIAYTGQFPVNMNDSITFCLNNRTNPHNCLNASQTINSSLDKIVYLASTNLSVNTSYKIERVWVTEEQPFEVVFWMNISYNISDEIASWRTSKVIRSVVSAEGIRDPLYQWGYADGDVVASRNFSQTTLKVYSLNASGFESYYRNGSYIYLPLGPSVLQRFIKGYDLNSTCCGIESVVRFSDLTIAVRSEPPFANYSFVDYHFFDRGDPSHMFDCNKNQVAAIGTQFSDPRARLDTFHLFTVYQANGTERFDCTP